MLLENIPLRGSGSSFAIGLYNIWFSSLYVNQGIQVSYQENNLHEALKALQNASNSYTFAGTQRAQNPTSLKDFNFFLL